MRICFGARMDVNQTASYVNPQTGRADKLSQAMAFATIPLFNDPLTRFVLENTRDEVQVTPRRVQYQSRRGPGRVLEGMEFTIHLRGIPHYPDNMGMTIGFNPFAKVGKKGGIQGGFQAKDRILNAIVERHEFANQLLAQPGSS